LLTHGNTGLGLPQEGFILLLILLAISQHVLLRFMLRLLSWVLCRLFDSQSSGQWTTFQYTASCTTWKTGMNPPLLHAVDSWRAHNVAVLCTVWCSVMCCVWQAVQLILKLRTDLEAWPQGC
jgi:hypothetical protein